MKIEWLNTDVDGLTNGLIERFNVKPYLAQDQARRFANLAEPLRADFRKFWETGSGGTTVEVEGYSWRRLTDEYKMVPTGAWSTLDWLHREPEKAKAALQRGYDFFGEPPAGWKK